MSAKDIFDDFSPLWEASRNFKLIFEKFFYDHTRLNWETGEIETTLALSDFSKNILTIGGITIAVILLTFLAIGIAILINQRKIKKQLKKLLEEKEDKPN